MLCPQPQSILISDHLPKIPSWRLPVTSTRKTALFSPSRDSDPQACLHAKDYKISSWKASIHHTPEVSLSLRLSQAGLNPTKKHMGLIFCLFAFPLLAQGPYNQGHKRVTILDQTGMHPRVAWCGEPCPKAGRCSHS